MNDIRKARQEGRTARRAGIGSEANPHGITTSLALRKNWLEGWQAANDEIEDGGPLPLAWKPGPPTEPGRYVCVLANSPHPTVIRMGVLGEWRVNAGGHEKTELGFKPDRCAAVWPDKDIEQHFGPVPNPPESTT